MTNSAQSHSGGPPPLLVSAIKKILRPLVKLMLSYQITYPYIAGLLKSIYVDVAESEFKVAGKRPSDSRINLLTGVHRKDVKKLRAETKVANVVPSNISVGAQLIGEWLGSEEFTAANGTPKPLPLKTSAASDTGFDMLVAKICKQDIRPRVILDEWLRLGIAHVENEHVILNTGAFTPEKGFDEKVFFFGKNLQDHISAGSQNLLGSRRAFFDRSVYYDNLSENSVQELSKLANTLGMQALTEMNKQALKKQRADKALAGAQHRINFGIFNYSASTHNDDEPT
ncbi:MAG: hypothetical protein COA96_00925 [SAR86 cluster bacterium]|uniref:Uncharacterized protein n=1 Tax=SAR86 cluster bacterium TaxID=2030880 RepID=A0A2A5BBA9_9GAMM|nr:MAG: hypothetical protein COA96_00925 [SAR86 cluster bacterium]